MRRSFFSILFLIFFQQVYSLTVQVAGKSLLMPGEKLVFLKYGNQITFEEIPLATTVVSSDGSFSCTFDIQETTYVFIHSGIYYGFFFAVPGMNCKLELPTHRSRLPGEQVNPYFEESKVQLPVHDSNKNAPIVGELLNQHIYQFDTVFESVFAKYSMNAFAKIGSGKLDSVILEMNATFQNDTESYFRQYYTYRIGLLRFMFSQYKSRHISDSYFIGKPILFQNPAYMELLNQVFDKYFAYFTFTKQGKAIEEAISQSKSIARLMSVMAKDTVLKNDTLMGIVLLKNLYDGFYTMDYSRETIIQIVDSIILTENIPLCKNLAVTIQKRITRLYAGYEPPIFKLLNQDSVFISNKDLYGALTYLVFCSTGSYSSVKEFDQLKKLQQKYGNRIAVVTIAMDNSFEDMNLFYKKSPYKWTFLYGGDHPELIREYDVRTFPAYYLIDAAGKTLLAPAPSPEENIDETIFSYLKNKGQL